MMVFPSSFFDISTLPPSAFIISISQSIILLMVFFSSMHQGFMNYQNEENMELFYDWKLKLYNLYGHLSAY